MAGANIEELAGALTRAASGASSGARISWSYTSPS